MRMYKNICVLVVLLMPGAVIAECNPFWPDWECVFKREDTHLIMNQPARQFVEEDKVNQMISEADVFIANYYSTVKSVEGDLGMRGEAVRLMADILKMEVSEGIAVGVKLQNDPWNLKTIYTDIVCQIYWDVLEGVTGVARTCPTTNDLLLSAQQLQKLEEKRQAIQDMILNPNLVIGEEWSAIEADIINIRNKYDALVSFGKNVAMADVIPKYQLKMSSYEEMLTKPLLRTVPYEDKFKSLSEMEHATYRDIMKATGENYRQSVNEDNDELERLKDMSEKSVGRMQAMEVENMLGVQKVQKWSKITEQVLNTNNFMSIEMGVNQSWKEEDRSQHLKTIRPHPDPLKRPNTNDGTGFLQ